jgi:hypothetical protein
MVSTPAAIAITRPIAANHETRNTASSLSNAEAYQV